MNKIYLSILIGSFSFAQTIDFDTALNLSLTNSKDLKKQELNTKQTELNIQELDSISYGKLNFEEQISKTNHSGHVFNSILSSREASFNDFGFAQYTGDANVVPNDLNNPDARTNFLTKFSYDVPLFTGFALSKQKEILKLQKKANLIKYNLDKKQLSFEVLKAYNGAVVAKEFIKATNKAKDAINYVVKSANAFHEDGLVTKIDVMQAQVYKLNINSKLIEAQNKLNLSLAYLKFLTSNDKISDVAELKNINTLVTKKDDLYQKALDTRGEIKMQSYAKDAMKKNIEVNNASYYPNIYSHLEYGFNDNTLSIDKDKDYYIAMLGLNYSLFDNTRDIKKQKSKVSYQKTSLDLEKLKDAIKLELEKSILDLKSKKRILKEKNEAKNLAQEVFDQSTLMYKNQLIPMTNLLEQEANLRKNEAELIVAKYENSLAQAKLALVLGENFSNKKGNK